MAVFTTEFRMRAGFGHARFVAELWAWLGGSQHYSILDNRPECELSQDYAKLETKDGRESLILQGLTRDEGFDAVGLRYDIRDGGLLWRSEIVAKFANHGENGALLRMRTACMSSDGITPPKRPQRPVLLKTLMNEKLLAPDGDFTPRSTPYDLDPNNDTQIDRIRQGAASLTLPILYLPPDRIPRNKGLADLAFHLGGVAHVVTGPDLPELASVSGVFLPDVGLAQRLTETQPQRLQIVLEDLRGRMSKKGWDWVDLQDAVLTTKRDRERNRLSAEESDALYQEEIRILQDKLGQADEENTRLRAHISKLDKGTTTGPLPDLSNVPEIWAGEIRDRLRAVLGKALADPEWHPRSHALFQDMISALPPSSGKASLQQELKQSATDAKRFADRADAVLRRCGYQQKAGNKHNTYSSDRLPGVAPVTVMKTPSDYKGLRNWVSQTCEAMGMKDLKDKD